MKQRSFIFIESNTSGTGHEFVQTAAALGFNSVVFAEDPGRYSYLQAGVIPYRSICTRDHKALITELDKLQRSSEIAAIYSTSDHFIAIAAELAYRYGLKGANADSIRRCRDKYQQRMQLQKGGIPVPRFWRVRSKKEFERIMPELVFPVVVKPVSGTGSVDVLLCRTAAEVAAHVAKLLACKTNERGMEITPEALIEEYVHGPEYSVETFNHCIVGITGKHLSPEPHFVETGHDFPAELPPPIAQLLGSTVLMALRALELGFGPAHTEIRYSPERGPVLIEVNPRLAGGFIPWLIKLALGVDLIHATVALVSGHEADLRPKHAGSASIRFIVSPEEGVLHAMNGLDEAKTMPGIADVRLYGHSGNYISLKHDFRDRLGHVIATGPSADAAASIASKALSQIKINFAPSLELAR